MNLSRVLCCRDNTASEQHLNTIIEATVVISILSVWTQICSAICFANACDFGHTSLLNSRSDWHLIAQGPIFQAAKKPRVDIPQLLEARIAWMHSWIKINRQKVLSPASVQREFCSIGLFLSECLREMGQRWAMQDFAPCQRFLLPSD